MNENAKLDICAWCSRPTWCEKRANGYPQCYGCRAVKYFRWMFGHLGFTLLPWMQDFLFTVYGTVEVETGLRQYRDCYLSMAKKNGKSFIFGGMPIYHLDVEGEPDARAVGIATTRKQASEVFDSAAQLITANPELRGRFMVTKSSKTIAHRQKPGKYEVLSADGERNDGVRVSLGLVDELHRFRSAKEEGILDAVVRGARGRKQPLIAKISTAGDPTDSQIWLREMDYARKVIAGEVKDRRYYARIYEADPERLKRDPEYWKSKEARLAGNPSHEDFGGFISDEELERDLQKAIETPHEQTKYFRYTLNAMAESEDKLLRADEWQACSTETRPLLGRRCFAGLDLSETSDFTALVLAFPDDDDSVDLLPFFWVPSEKVRAIAQQLGPMGSTFQRWVREGLVTACEGPVVDYADVRRKLDWAREEFDLSEVCIDRWNARQFIADLEKDSYRVVEISQTAGALTSATKGLRDMVAQRLIRHGGHEVLAWHAACVAVKQDLDGNVKPRKIKRNEEAVRIDGIAATINALDRILRLRSVEVPSPMEVAWR